MGLKLAIMGLGLFAEKSIMPAIPLCKSVELVAITKRDQAEAATFAESHGIPKAYATDDEAFLQDPGIDAVFVTGPNYLHRAHAEMALAAGKHVLVEKPMAMNATECESMIAAANAAGRQLMVAQCFRFNTTVNHIKALIDGGQLGRLLSITCDFMSQGRESKRKWKYDKAVAGGGAAFDLGVHLVDTARYLAQSPIRSTSVIAEPADRARDEVESLASFAISFENGAVARLTSAYDGPRHTYLEVYGSTGFVRAYDFNLLPADVRVECEIGGETVQTKVTNEDPYANELDVFAEAVLGGTPVPVPGEEGLENQRIIDLVNR